MSHIEYKDVLLTLDIPYGTTSVIAYDEIFNIKNHTIQPTSKKAFYDCIEDLIRYAIDLAQDMQESLMSNLHHSYYFLVFKVKDKKYVYNEKNAVKYFHHCMHNDLTPHFFVNFMYSCDEEKTVADGK